MTFRTLPAVAATLLALCMAGPAQAGPALSWNLSRDIMHNTPNNNPNGPWTYMWSATPHNESTYFAFNVFDAPCQSNGGQLASTRCWRDAVQGFKPVLIVADQPVTAGTVPLSVGVPIAYPGPTQAVIVRWISPATGIARIGARLSDIDPSCGNGIQWSIDKHNTTIVQGNITNTTPGYGRSISTKASVAVGDPLYFIIEAGSAANSSCDPTEIDLLITMQQ